MVERKQYQQYISNIQHILSVIEERINLYKKRKLEVKRYLKTIHRSNSLPSASSIFILLEAEIQYEINNAIYQVLSALLQEIQINNQLIAQSNNIKQSIQYEKLVRILMADTRFIERFGKQISISASEIAPVLLNVDTLRLYLRVIFIPDEEYQREYLAKYIQQYSYDLLLVILEEIAIFDSDFLNNVNNLLLKYLSKILDGH